MISNLKKVPRPSVSISIFVFFALSDLIAKMAKRSRRESNSSEDEGGGKQEGEKEEGEASDEENE